MLDLALWRARFKTFMTLRQWSPRTVDSYTQALRPFFEYLDAVGVDTLAALTRDVLEGFRQHLFEVRPNGKPLTLRTQAVKLGAIKAFTRFLLREGLVLVDAGAGLDLPKVPRSLPRAYFSEAQVARLAESPDVTQPLGLRNRAILEVLYGTAIRNSELCDLTLEDMDLVNQEVRVRCGKGGRSRVLPLGDAAQYWVEAYLRSERVHLVRASKAPWLFLSWRGQRLTRCALSAMVRAAGEAVELPRPVTPHILRHCCATHMLARGASLRHLQEFLGHATLGTTQLYTRVELSDLHRVLRRCHPRARGGGV